MREGLDIEGKGEREVGDMYLTYEEHVNWRTPNYRGARLIDID